MGQALLKGLLEGGRPASDVVVFDVDPKVCTSIREQYGVSIADSGAELVDSTDFIVLCVKPESVSRALAPVGNRDLTIVSIAAGVTLDNLADQVGSDSQIIRVMPNTPAQVGTGMSFLCPGGTVDDEFLEQARDVLESVGEVAVVDDESLMDTATALSGSGPGYVFYFLEAMVEVGKQLGLDPATANKATIQTLKGSAKLVSESSKSPEELRREVTSPGGTTEEALNHLERNEFKSIVQEAIQAARDRSVELGNE
jgi:pyrroline-5-carboxylate reductase